VPSLGREPLSLGDWKHLQSSGSRKQNGSVISNGWRFVLPPEAHAAFRTCWECVLSVTGHSSCSFHCIPARPLIKSWSALRSLVSGDGSTGLSASVALNRSFKPHEASSAGEAFLKDLPHLEADFPHVSLVSSRLGSPANTLSLYKRVFQIAVRA